MSKEIKVISTEKNGGNPVPSDEIETTINQMLSQGWSFLQLSTGGVCEVMGSYMNPTTTWVYLLFERS